MLVIFGDAARVLKRLPENVDCVVTSPPYFRMRDYEVDGQIGQEDTVSEYIDKLVAVFDEVFRVLKPSGTLWINIGDCYSKRSNIYEKKPKNLVGLGWRLAEALQEKGGWILRNDIIWYKRNAPPESVKDRFSRKYEHIFLFAKSYSYYFDLNAVRVEPTDKCKKRVDIAERNKERGVVKRINVKRCDKSKIIANRYDNDSDWMVCKPHPLGSNPGDVWDILVEPTHYPHTAVFPKELVRRCILAGVPKRVCKECGVPFVPQYKERGYIHEFKKQCECAGAGDYVRGVVLDPFLGSGTTLVVAQELGVDGIGIEINSSYKDIIINRLSSGLFKGEGLRFEYLE